MRSIPILTLLIITILLIILSGFCFIALQKLTKQKTKILLYRIFYFGYWMYTLFMIFYFVYLFIYPKTAATSTNYSLYFVFNIFFITDIFVKILISFTLFLYYFFRILKIDRLSIVWSGVVISTGIIFSVVFGSTIGKNQIRVENVSLKFENLPSSFDGLKIVHLSDIHLGSFSGDNNLLEKGFSKINSLSPDLILFTGDLVNNFSTELDGYTEVFESLYSRYGKYSILGNHDYGDYFNWEDDFKKSDNFSKIKLFHGKCGFQLLENESVPIEKSGDTIFVFGVENWGHPPFPQYADLDKALSGSSEGNFRILLTHDPAHWESKVKGKEDIALTLSGHTHGMQLGTKVAGIEFSPMMYFVRKYWGGLYGKENQYLYVNKGFGTIGLNFRIEMPPEITVITLTKS